MPPEGHCRKARHRVTANVTFAGSCALQLQENASQLGTWVAIQRGMNAPQSALTVTRRVVDLVDDLGRPRKGVEEVLANRAVTLGAVRGRK